MRDPWVKERDAVFIISVAARLVELHPSTLRKYERCGLLEPCRPSGRLRLYSPEDIARLRQIKTLVDDRKINLAGVELALAVTERALALRRLCDVENDPERLRAAVRRLADDLLTKLGLDSNPSEATDREPERAEGEASHPRGSK